MINLRPYQAQVKSEVYDAWAAHFRSVLLIMPTGGGKTKTFCSIVIDTLESQGMNMPTAILVHRKELVQQICLTLAEEGVQHNIIAARKDIKGIIAAERRMFNQQYYDPNALVTVISVDTLKARKDIYAQWVLQIRQVIVDEAAHVLAENKWGHAISLFKNARILGVTATPERLDKKGLGSHADGIFDVMVQGPNTAWMIEQGFLSRYKIAMPESNYSQYLETKNTNSDYSKSAMMEASQKSTIIGDVVENYQKHAAGKQAILFASDVATAKDMEKKFLEAGIKAKSLDGTTPDNIRLDTLIKFRAKEIQVLLNVDLFDEGLDVVGIECVIMARPTKSLGKFLQMVGRGLRIAEGKEFMILIDHVGNVTEHGLPCQARKWTLDRIRKSGVKLNFLRICNNVDCNAPYDRALTECPWCGAPAIIMSRAGGETGTRQLKQVDGDLFLIDPEVIRAFEAQANLEDPASVGERVGNAVNGAAGLRATKLQQERILMQNKLAEAIAKWAGVMKTRHGYTDRTIHKKFYLCHRETITEALGGKKKEMEITIQQLTDNEGWY